jgi:Ca-activated chloride channel family protein
MQTRKLKPAIATAVGSLLFLSACTTGTSGGNGNQQRGFEVKFLAGSDLAPFCNRAAKRFNQTQPTLESGQAFYLTCETKGSGDVVSQVVSLVEQLNNGSISADNPQFPTLISVDGEIYYSQLRYQIEQIYPGQNYIPPITDAPLLAYSPMVFMTTKELASGVRQQENIFQALIEAETHQDFDPNDDAIPINYVHTAPTRSNSGLQTLVAEFASVSGKPPEQMTKADVQKYQDQVQQIESKVARYGASTGRLAKDMVDNGVFWASVGSVYESFVIQANSNPNSQTRYEAVYPKATFSSNMRAIVANAPWMSDREKAAAQQVIQFLRSQDIQKIATDVGLRPGVPGVPLGPKFSSQYGVNPNPTYDSLRPPSPEVTETMLTSWKQYAKKPSQVAIVVDSSGSMQGNKLPAVQSTLRTYIENLGPRERIALIDFDSQIREPVQIEGNDQGRQQAMQFITSLQADGGTRLYDAALQAQKWLQQNYRQDAINAVLILTDGQDSDSNISLDQLKKQLQEHGFSSDKRMSFFTVGYGQKGEFNPQVLQTIAELNGGYYRKGNPQTISQLMSDLQLEF